MDKQLRRWADGWTVGKPLKPKPETKAAKNPVRHEIY